MGTISPLSSATSMKRSGPTIEPDSSMSRTRASKPSTA
jgi:hypothetical protein